MSAREDARREMTHGHLYLDEDRANELLDAYRAEVLREAAAEIRRIWPHDYGAGVIAEHIDPDSGVSHAPYTP